LAFVSYGINARSFSIVPEATNNRRLAELTENRKRKTPLVSRTSGFLFDRRM
jgi:hypothetical protein